MSEQDAQARLQLYLDREAMRAKMGPSLMAAFRHAESLEDSEEKESMIGEIRDYAKRHGSATGKFLDDLQAAAKTQRPEGGINRDVSLRSLDPEEITSMAGPLKIHPAVFAEWTQRIKIGEMKTIVAFEYGEPVGRVNFIYPAPREQEVVEELGGSVPWIHALWINENQRFKGIGARLTIACEDQVLMDPQLPRIIGLAVRPDNVIARGLYEKLGYQYRTVGGQETFESLPEFEGAQPTTTFLMVKDLSEGNT